MDRRPTAARELDLVPIMNLVTILIPFLLLSASFVSLGAIDTTLPAMSPPPPLPDPEPSLALRVEVTPGGYALEANQPLPEPTAFARVTNGFGVDAWPVEELAVALAALNVEDETVILVPEGTVPYDVLIQTMDAARGAGFTSVVMGGGT